jgi:O-antigen/teichoic acid export membrane protein
MVNSLKSRWRSWLGTSIFLTLARVLGAGAGFLTQIFLIQVLGTHELGIFYAANSVAVVASVFASGGFPGITQRFVTRYRERAKPSLLSAFIRHTQAATSATTLAIGFVLLVIILFWPASVDTRLAFAASVFTMGAMAALNINLAFASAEGHFGIALLPETFVRPFVFLTAVVLVALIGASISSGEASSLYAAITAIVAVAQYILLRPYLSLQHSRSITRSLTRKWRQEATPLILVALFTNLYADISIFLAAPFMALSDTAVFGICVKLSMLVGFVVQVSQQVALPELALAHERGDGMLQRRVILRAALLPSLVTLAATLLVMLWGDLVLGAFSSEFASAKWTLAMMTGAQFVRAVAGPNVSMLSLTGAQRLNSTICLGAGATLLIANLVLIPHYGLFGAAVAMSCSYVAWSITVSTLLWTKFGVRTDLLACMRRAAKDLRCGAALTVTGYGRLRG